MRFVSRRDPGLETKLAIAAAHGPLGAEIVRLAVAFGLEGLIDALGPRAEPPAAHAEAPWVRGARWHAPDDQAWQLAQARADALILALPELIAPRSTLALYGATTASALVLVAPQGVELGGLDAIFIDTPRRVTLRVAPRLVSFAELASAHDEVHDVLEALESGALEDEAQWLEVAAMAALRAALEPWHHGELSCQDVEELGSAMMIQ